MRRLRTEPLEDRRVLSAVTVTNNLDVVNGDTSSIANLIASDGGDGIALREAIEAANNTAGADRIDFDFGHEGPETILLQLGELEITEALTISGDGPDLLTIDAQQNSRVLDITARSGDFSLIGLTLTGGSTVAAPVTHGGAIRSLTVDQLTIDQSTIAGNVTGVSGVGGGISAEGNVTILASTISGNIAEIDGGGIFTRNDVIIQTSTISGNVANAREGGGVSSSGNVTIESSTIDGNTAGRFGGGLFLLKVATVTDSTFSNNRSYYSGGGIFTKSLTLTSSTVSGNSATARGGGIYCLRFLGSLNVSYSTITDNHTMGKGGGIYQPGGQLGITGSIVAGNTADVNGDDLEASPTSDEGHVDYSLIGFSDGSVYFALMEGIGNLMGVDPELGPLADNGGPTMTHALLPGSPAIDAGDPTAVAGLDDVPLYDQRAEPFGRVVDIIGTGSRIDMGAYELQKAPTGVVVVDTLVDEYDTDFSPGDVSLREAIGWARTLGTFDTITFGPSLDEGTILLELGEITLHLALTVDALNLPDGITIDAQQNSRVFNITATSGDFAFAGLTLTHGKTTAGSLSIPSRFAAFGGGAIRSSSEGLLTLDRVTLTENTSEGDHAPGGAVFTDGNLTISRSLISNNSTLGDYAHGGAVYADGTLTVAESTVSGNTTAGYVSFGGGLSGADVSVYDSVVSDNHTYGRRGYGGGIMANFGTLTISRSTIHGNSTSGQYARGGGISGLGAPTVVVDSTISGNGTTGDESRGGGIDTGILVMTGSTVSGNSTAGMNANGGGINAFVITVAQSTIADNHVFNTSASGGGISTINAPVIIRSSIVADNSAGGDSPDLFPGTGTINATHSLVGDSSGTNLSEAPTADADGNLIGGLLYGVIDPLLGPLKDNGGPTFTHALLPHSPAIDAGLPGSFIFDQRGASYLRVQGAASDIGAYEVLPADANLDGAVDCGDYMIWMQSFHDSPAQDPPGVPANGDFNGDGLVDGLDYLAWASNFGAGAFVPPSALVVDTLVDEVDNDFGSGELSLREAVGWSNALAGVNPITFDPSLASGTIQLELGELTLTDATSIDATKLTGGVIIDAQQRSRIAHIITGSGDVELRGLMLTGGRTVLELDSGGAIRALTTGDLTLDRTVFTGNGTSGPRASGGAIYALRSDVTLYDSEVGENETLGDESWGGGISTAIGSVTLVNSIVDGNRTVGESAPGGGISASSSDVSLVRSTVAGNSTAGTYAGGGGINVRFAEVTVADSTISGNSTGGTSAHGGGIAIYKGRGLSLHQSTVSGNITAGENAHGGAIYNLGGAVGIFHSTLSGNATTGVNSNGGAILVVNYPPGSPVTIDHSIVAENASVQGANPDLNPDTGTLTVNHSLIGDTSDLTQEQLDMINAGTGNLLDVDPLLGPLADNGGPTMTHALLPGSPAIDAGDPAFVGPPYLDQRGYYRVVDGDGDMMARVDMGAVEFGSVAAKPGDGNLDGVVDGLDYILWAMHFGDDPAVEPPGAPLNGDFNDDGKVDGLDYIVWAMNFELNPPPVVLTAHEASTSTASDVSAVDTVIESEYAADRVLAVDANVNDWLISRAFDLVFAKKHALGKF